MDSQIASMERLFQALGDGTRLRIVGLLLTGEICVCDIHVSLGISQPKASRHLAYLRRAGLVDTRRDGLWVYYRLAQSTDVVIAVVQQAVQHALSHDSVVHRDARQLRARNGSCLPTPSAAPGLACCAPPPPRARRKTK